MNTTPEQAAVLLDLFSRYAALIIERRDTMPKHIELCSPTKLMRLCEEGAVHSPKYPFDKMCRWLGFVQGVLAMQGIIDVDEERDYTRPLFHKLYGTEVPTFSTLSEV